MVRLIGVVKAEAGLVKELTTAMSRRVGVYPCSLTQLVHSPKNPNREWRDAATRLHNEFGHTLELVYANRRTEAVEAASSGREPCILIEDEDGALAMIADWNDLELADGDVAVFERILRSKLLMY
jgi:hypothetical protein